MCSASFFLRGLIALVSGSCTASLALVVFETMQSFIPGDGGMQTPDGKATRLRSCSTRRGCFKLMSLCIMPCSQQPCRTTTLPVTLPLTATCTVRPNSAAQTQHRTSDSLRCQGMSGGLSTWWSVWKLLRRNMVVVKKLMQQVSLLGCLT